MSDPREWHEKQFTVGGYTTVVNVSTDDETFIHLDYVDSGMPSAVMRHDDGKVTYGFEMWPPPKMAEPYGDIVTVTMPPEMSNLIGRVVVQGGVVQTRIKALLRRLTAHNKTTLEFEKLNKHDKLVTRLQAEAKRIETDAPVAAQMLFDGSEPTRSHFKSRNQLAHGELATIMNQFGFYLLAQGKHGQQWFTISALQDLALRLCRASFLLKAALDPDHPRIQRASPETRFLRDFRANNPPTHPIQPTLRPPPRS